MPLTDLEKQQHELLREIEWAGGTFEDAACPCCRRSEPRHAADCKLQACLMAAAAKQATPTVRESRTPHVTDVSNLQPEPFPSTPLCPQCHSKATYQSSESYPDRSRVCSCHNGHTWALDAQGAEI